MDSFPYENWLHDTIVGVSAEGIESQSPENWIRFTLRHGNSKSEADDQTVADASDPETVGKLHQL